MRYPNDIRVVVKPKMTNHRGRTWDHCTVVLPDGRSALGHYDTTWGTQFYFQCPDDLRWRAGSAYRDTGRCRYAIYVDLQQEYEEETI